jgi:hypothetical protein
MVCNQHGAPICNGPNQQSTAPAIDGTNLGARLHDSHLCHVVISTVLLLSTNTRQTQQLHQKRSPAATLCQTAGKLKVIQDRTFAKVSWAEWSVRTSQKHLEANLQE